MKRPPGRPPLDALADAPSADVHLTLPATDYDHLHRLATQGRESVPNVIRRGIKLLLTDERGGPIRNPK